MMYLNILWLIPIIWYVQKLRKRNKQDTFEWREGDKLEVFGAEFDNNDFIGFSGKYVIYKNYFDRICRASLWRVIRNISLDERKAKEYMKFREELYKEEPK